MTRREDLTLVRSIVDGSLISWHEFLDKYSGLIFGVLRRHLFAADEDDIRTVYVDILKALYEGSFSKYEGRSRLSTWLIVFTRSRAVDYYREKFGRVRMPKGYEQLEEFDREVLKLYFIDHLPMEAVVSTLRWKGHAATADDIVGAVRRIVDLVDGRYIHRCDNEHMTRMYGLDSLRLAGFLLNLRCEYEGSLRRNRPDARILEKESAATADKALEKLSALRPDERKVIYLKFYRGMSARKIADSLGFSSARRVYYMIDKALKKLRALDRNDSE